MLNVIDRAFQNRPCYTEPGWVTVCNVDSAGMDPVKEWLSGHPGVSVGAMGTRAKQLAGDHQINLDFTYGVIDKCILKALLGEDSVIFTAGSMVQRVFDRVDDFSRENGVAIPVSLLDLPPR
jgi:cobalt/nickel transport system ATP-binding protein